MGHSLNRTSFRINQNLIIDDTTFNPGYILVSDVNGNASWRNPSEYISNEEPLDHFIGELYGGGIVVAVWREQRETLYEICLISSVKNFNNAYYAWSTTNNLSIGATARSNTFGASNSYYIIDKDHSYPAAAINCSEYINEDLYGLGVYGDWYLPATFELNCLANNSAIVDRVISQYATDKSLLPFNDPASKMTLFENRNDDGRDQGNGYWTSTEYNSGSAYYLNVGSVGGVRFATASKSLTKMVRPFRQDVKRWNGISWVQDRKKTGQILIVYDQAYLEGATNFNTLMINNITTTETGLGNTVFTIVGYSALPPDLSQYDHIWDIGLEANANQSLLVPTGAAAKYTTYLQQGGGIFILGENSGFNVRNGDLGSFITGLGGGTIQTSGYIDNRNLTVSSEFLLANNQNILRFPDSGRFSSIGTGTPITTNEYGQVGQAVIWKTGSLSLAPKGAIVVVLDVNFLSNYYAPGSAYGGGLTYAKEFVDNISLILNKS